jgi:hypothetical protein
LLLQLSVAHGCHKSSNILHMVVHVWTPKCGLMWFCPQRYLAIVVFVMKQVSQNDICLQLAGVSLWVARGYLLEILSFSLGRAHLALSLKFELFFFIISTWKFLLAYHWW